MVGERERERERERVFFFFLEKIMFFQLENCYIYLCVFFK